MCIVELKNQKTDFGVVVGSAFGVVDIDGQPVSEDWLVIKVDPDRVGENHICGAVAARRGQRGLQWVPRDWYGVYVSGVEHLRRGAWVRKCGRTTGDTVGEVGFAYAHAKFDDNPTETRELTVITSAFGDTPIFGGQGDSGAAVVDRQGNLVGVVLSGTRGQPTVLKGHENLGPVFVTYINPASSSSNALARRLDAESSCDSWISITCQGSSKSMAPLNIIRNWIRTRSAVEIEESFAVEYFSLDRMVIA